MSKEFIYCPRCASDNIEQTDYEEENEDGRRCEDCGWEGDVSNLVCKN